MYFRLLRVCLCCGLLFFLIAGCKSGGGRAGPWPVYGGSTGGGKLHKKSGDSYVAFALP